MVKVLFTGKGVSGSWQIRGVQVGEAIGATVKPHATLADMRAHDVIVLVKRPTRELVETLQICGRPFVWDPVDSWPQPDGNDWPETRALCWLREQIQHVSPHGLICATKAMQRDADFELSETIYHHAHPSLTRHRNLPMTHDWTPDVVYVGGPNYLGEYASVLHALCNEMHWAFKPDADLEALQTAEIALCLRDCKGYAPRHWKSNVKLANAQALGIPAICSPESGYAETSTGGVLWVESPQDLRAAFDALSDPQHYARVCAAVDRPPTLAEISRQYVAFLRRVVDRCA